MFRNVSKKVVTNQPRQDYELEYYLFLASAIQRAQLQQQSQGAASRSESRMYESSTGAAAEG